MSGEPEGKPERGRGLARGAKKPALAPGEKPPITESVRALMPLLPRAARLAVASAPRSIAAIVGLTLGMAFIPPAIAWVGKLLVDAVVAQHASDATRYILVEVALVTLLVTLQRTSQHLRMTVGARLGHDVNVKILKKALTLDLKDFEDPEFYDQLTRARREASNRPISVVVGVFDLVKSMLLLGGYAALIVGYSPLVCLALVLATIPATVSETYFGREAFRLRNWRSPDTRRLYYIERILATDEHAKEVKLLGIGDPLLDRYASLGDRVVSEDLALARRRLRWGTALSLLATGIYYGVYATMVIAAAQGKMTIGEMTLYAASFRQGQEALQAILSSVGGMHEHALYLSNLYGYLDRPTSAILVSPRAEATDAEAEVSATPEHTETKAPHPSATNGATTRGATLATPISATAARLTLEDVSFKYPGADRWVIRNLSLDIPAGQSLALVGENGAGKTTLVKLLLGFYAPTEGRILLDGRDLSSLPEAERLASFSVVFQDFARYQFTVRENVGFGDVEHLDDDARLTQAIERGGADPVVERLPGGIDSQLGKIFDGGVELSGGEWQKIALARSFVREDARVLILDEPTAALDAGAEHAIFDRFRKLTAGRTSILISHRFPTVRIADRIVVIGGGSIKEQGTHDSLVAEGGIYARLFALQAEGYR